MQRRSCCAGLAPCSTTQNMALCSTHESFWHARNRGGGWGWEGKGFSWATEGCLEERSWLPECSLLLSTKAWTSNAHTSMQECLLHKIATIGVTQMLRAEIEWFLTWNVGRIETYPRTAPMMVPATSPPRPRFSLKRPPVTAAHRQSLVSSKVLKRVRTQQVDGVAEKAF